MRTVHRGEGEGEGRGGRGEVKVKEGGQKQEEVRRLGGEDKGGGQGVKRKHGRDRNRCRGAVEKGAERRGGAG